MTLLTTVVDSFVSFNLIKLKNEFMDDFLENDNWLDYAWRLKLQILMNKSVTNVLKL